MHSSTYSIQIQLGHNNFPHETPTFHLDVLEWLNPRVDFSMCATSRNLTYRSGTIIGFDNIDKMRHDPKFCITLDLEEGCSACHRCQY